MTGEVAAVIAHTDERLHHRIPIRDVPNFRQYVCFGHGGRVVMIITADFRRYGLVDHVIEIGGADGLQHVRDVSIRRANMPADEFATVFQVAQGRFGHGGPPRFKGFQ